MTSAVRLGNRTQISTKTVSVSGTQEATLSAGRKSEMGYQMYLKSMEIKRDMEFALTQNNVASVNPRRLRGLVGWADAANINAGAGYVAPNYITNVAQTDGTLRAFTEAQLKDVAQKVYTSGGNPDVLMMGPSQKQTFSTFTGNSTRFDKGEDEKLYAAIDVYVTDFGSLKAIPNRFQRPRDVWMLQSDMWSVDYLRPFETKELAKTGDSTKKMIVVEYTLRANNPKANGLIADVL